MKTADQILDNVVCCTIEEDAEDVKENYYYRHNDVVKAIEQAQKEASNQATEDDKEKILTITGEDNPYPLRDVLKRLIWATEYLLHVKNYDGHQYEELGQCVRRAREIMESILKLKK